jgi:uncharacterized membrane protein
MLHCTAAVIPFHLPQNTVLNTLMLYRFVHLVAGITWIGLLYFFNLVNVPFMKELDAPTKGKVVPSLMPRALWWFRWGALVTVLSGIAYWMHLVVTAARGAEVSPGSAIWSFFAVWTAVWALIFLLTCVLKINDGRLLGVLAAVVVVAGCWVYLSLNNHGWETNKMLAIGLGGGMGWVMMLNVWGVIWRFQKKIIRWTKDNAANGTAMPEQAKALARQAFLTSRTNAYLSLPMLFLMAAASHYPMFGM